VGCSAIFVVTTGHYYAFRCLGCILIQGCLIDMVGFLLGSFALFSWNLFNLQVLLLFLFVAIVFVPIRMLFFFYSWVRLNTSNFKLVSSLTFVAYCHTRPCMACFCRELVIVFGFVYIMYISLCLSRVSTSFCMVWLYPIFFFFGSLFPFCLFFSLVHVYGIAGLPAWLLLIFIHIYILIKKN
jgi:hypothetical protein